MPEAISKIREWRDERARCIEQARAVNEKARSENRALTEQEETEFNQWTSRAEELFASIQREETLRDQELRSLAPGRTSEPPAPSNPMEPRALVPLESRDNQLAEIEQRQLTAFRGFCGRGLSSLSPDQMRDLGTARTQIFRPDTPPQELRDMTAGLDLDGGFLYAPISYSQQVVQALNDDVVMRGLATVESLTNADSLGIPTIEEDPGDPEWTTEIAEVPRGDGFKLGGRQLKPTPLAIEVLISHQLLRRSSRAEAVLLDKLRHKNSITLELHYTMGNGENQPLGVFYPSEQGIPTSRDVSEGNTAVPTIEGCIHAKYTLRAPYWKNARWLFHQQAIKELLLFKDANLNYVWQPSVQIGQPDRLLSIPVMMSAFAPNLYVPGAYFGVLGDFRYYHIADALTMQIQRLNELYARVGKVGFIIRLETDGMPVLADAFVRLQLPN